MTIVVTGAGTVARPLVIELASVGGALRAVSAHSQRVELDELPGRFAVFSFDPIGR